MWKQGAVSVFVVLFAVSAFGEYGVDVSSAVSESGWSCLRNNGNGFAIIRAYQSNGRADPNAVQTVRNARAAGIPYVDVYMFPCPTCGNPQAQVQTAVNNLRSGGANFGMFWFDIEGPQYWSNQAYNRDFMNGLLSEARALGLKVGIYSSESQWIPIFGNWNGGAAYPLWYAHYDGSPSFSDFQPFAGWTKPNIKQYQGDAVVCGVGVDKNWYP